MSAPWCGPCKALRPAIDKLKPTLDNTKVVISDINIDENPELVSQYGVQAVPTFIFIKDSKPVDSFSGIKPIKEIQNIIEKWM